MLKGIDVYAGDGTVNWEKVMAAGFRFAFIKASQGTSIHDSRHATNIRSARDAGLMVGSYHFFLPTSNAAERPRACPPAQPGRRSRGRPGGHAPGGGPGSPPPYDRPHPG
jgi:GH25 family lysozyme M1 (1,4-beta-N-acetylmuramidase)